MIKRKLFKELVEHLPRKEISVIVGPRQAGKTTLMEMLRDRLIQEGERSLFLNLDIEWDRPHFESQAALLQKIELELGKEKGVVFIDEIQRKENAGLFLKGLYDLKLPYKIVVSGSGSLELKEKIHESLAGRKRLFELTTVSFEEFVDYKTNYRYEGRLADFLRMEKETGLRLLAEYMNFGGYPNVVLAPDIGEKLRIIDEIYRSVLEKDIAILLKVAKTDAFGGLLKLMADQIGSLANFSEISSTLGLSHQTVKKYLAYAEKIFLIRLVHPFARNIRKEISKSPVPYFWDLGLRNYILGIFGRVETPSEMGGLFENLVFLLLNERIRFHPAKLNFWRTTDKAEIDFIVEYGRRLFAVEAKYKHIKQEKVPAAMRSFTKKYRPDRSMIVNLDYRGSMTIEESDVRFVPFYELLKDNFFDNQA